MTDTTPTPAPAPKRSAARIITPILGGVAAVGIGRFRAGCWSYGNFPTKCVVQTKSHRS